MCCAGAEPGEQLSNATCSRVSPVLSNERPWLASGPMTDMAKHTWPSGPMRGKYGHTWRLAYIILHSDIKTSHAMPRIICWNIKNFYSLPFSDYQNINQNIPANRQISSFWWHVGAKDEKIKDKTLDQRFSRSLSVSSEVPKFWEMGEIVLKLFCHSNM